MTIRSNPHIWLALTLGFAGTIVSWHLLAEHSPIWAMTVGFGIISLILFIYPGKDISLHVGHNAIRITQGKRSAYIKISDLQGYRIKRIFTLQLILILTDGRRVLHPLEFVASVADVENALRNAGVDCLDDLPN